MHGQKDFYKDNVMYDVSVIDMLSPEVPVFTCGLNGDVREFPTRKPIMISGAQIKMLMSCNIPDEKTEQVDGLNKWVGHSEYPRFAITMRGYGPMPTERAHILNPMSGTLLKNKPAMDPTPETESEEPAPEEDITAMDEPMPDRKAELEGATMEELVRHATGLGIQIKQTWGRPAIIRAIVKAEEVAK